MRERRPRRRVREAELARWMPVFLLVATLAAAPASAQPAGVVTPHFRFLPDAGSVGLAEHLASIGETKRSYVLGLLGVADDRVIEVRIASDEAAMSRMVGSDRPVEDWIAGLAHPREGWIVLSARGNEVFNATDTFVHELAHVYLESVLLGHPCPRWFHEGFAMMVAGEEVGQRMKAFLGAAATGSFLPLEELEDSFPGEPPAVHLAYAQSQLFVRYLQRRGDGAGIRSLVQALRSGLPFELAFERTFQGPPDELWRDFLRTVDPWSSWLVFLTSAAVLWVLILLLFLWAYVRKRRRAAARKAMWAMKEELERLSAVPGPEEVQ